MGLDPVTWALIGTAVFSAAGAISSSNAQAKAQKQKAAVNEANAAQAKQVAAYNAQLKERETSRLIASQRARFGKSGVQFAGTPLDVVAEQAYQGDIDRQMTVYQGDLNAWRYTTEASFLEESADYTQSAGYTTAFGQLLGGATSATAYQKKATNPLSISYVA